MSVTGGSDWQGRVGSVWAEAWARTDRAFAATGAVLDDALAALAPQAGRALDVGCGAGSTALGLATSRPGLDVVGVDLSDDLIRVARTRSASIRFEVGDACVVARDLAPLSMLLSRHGVMFFDDPSAGFTALADACVPSAPLVFTCFRARRDNGWASLIDDAIGGPAPAQAERPETPGPFAFADRERVTALLEASGWTDIAARAHDVAYVFGAGPDPVADALAFASRVGPAAAVLASATPDRRAGIEGRLTEAFAARESDGMVMSQAAIWLWTARRDAHR